VRDSPTRLPPQITLVASGSGLPIAKSGEAQRGAGLSSEGESERANKLAGAAAEALNRAADKAYVVRA
jgi:hypothetical protein